MNGRDEGDMSPEVAQAATSRMRRHLGGFLVLMGLLSIFLPRVIDMPAQDTEAAVAPEDRRNIAEIATTNSTIMGVVSILFGAGFLVLKPKPRRFTM